MTQVGGGKDIYVSELLVQPVKKHLPTHCQFHCCALNMKQWRNLKSLHTLAEFVIFFGHLSANMNNNTNFYFTPG